MYKVIHDFADMQDNGYLYRTGNVFPRGVVNVDSARIAILLSNSNRMGLPLIAKVDKAPTTEKVEKPKTTEKLEKARGRRKKPTEE